jgi:hypothetical protein
VPLLLHPDWSYDMPRPGLITVVSLTWYLAVIAMMRWNPEARPPVVPPISPATVQLDVALEVLTRADRFYAAQIGYAGTTPAEVHAWQRLSRSPGADTLFKALAASTNRPTALYGLAGLYRTDASAYLRLAIEQRLLGGMVPTMIGCIGIDRPVEAVLAEMDRGIWTAEFTTGRLSFARPEKGVTLR